MGRKGLWLAAVLATFTGHQSQAACKKPAFSSPYLTPIPAAKINQTLFAEALRLEASFVRCKSGATELQNAAQLTAVAAPHSGWMARSHKLDHTSNVAGKQTMAARVRSTGLKFSTAAENIAAFDRFQFPTGQFKITNSSKCRFSYQNNKPIPAHSYASLAQTVVAGWMSSSGHRANLMNRRMKLAGAGLAYDAASPYCGRFYITQNYLG